MGDPLCDVCGHHHIHDVKCSVCGHKGKSKAYRYLQARGRSELVLCFSAFDTRTSSERLYCNKIALGKIMRRHVFVGERIMTSTEEFDETDVNCRHVLALIGDAPVCYARYRTVNGLSPGPTKNTTILIESLLTMAVYRRRGYARRMLLEILKDAWDVIPQVLGQQALGDVWGVVAEVPREKRMQGAFLHYGFVEFGEVYSDFRGYPFCRMGLSWSRVANLLASATGVSSSSSRQVAPAPSSARVSAANMALFGAAAGTSSFPSTASAAATAAAAAAMLSSHHAPVGSSRSDIVASNDHSVVQDGEAAAKTRPPGKKTRNVDGW